MSNFTIGVEEEYQLVDAATSELMSSAQSVLAGDWTGEIRTELQASTIEIGTLVCESSEGVRRELRRLRAQAAVAAGAQDLQIVAAGVHPFSDWRGQQLSGGERYARMAETYGRIARDEHNFGMHIHVAVEGDRMRLLNILRDYIPHLTALGCSSPFFEGEDSGYDSYRMVLWRRWPGAGPPPRLACDADYRRYVDGMLRAGVIGDERNLYWSIRPHAAYPTLEFRMCDVCPRISDAVAIAALIRTLVFAAAEGMLTPSATHWGPEAMDAALADDCWRACRSGLRARFVNPEVEPGFESASDAVLRLLDALAPAADMIGETSALTDVAGIIDDGTGADRLRAFHRECDDLVVATRWLAAETLVGAAMDRLGVLREVPECA
ncbi:MAG TPA: YbdK family carboxylate-amine ligase [Longimicrobiales bacterium]|nr:YbdK family carboxylate-amine ligase [Longimicrobiales bacterium]